MSGSDSRSFISLIYRGWSPQIRLTKLSSTSTARLQKVLLALCMAACFFSFTPKQAARGAPFARFSLLEIALSSCGMHLIGYEFCPNTENSTRFTQVKCLCTNQNAFATAAHCYSIAYPEQIENLIDMCNVNYNAGLTWAKFEAAIEFYNTRAKLLNPSPLLEVLDILDYPPKLNDLTILVYRDVYDQFLGNYNRLIRYGFYLVEFWVVVFALAAIGNWLKVLFPQVCKKLVGPVSNSTRRHITLPALFGRWKTKEIPFACVFDMLVPTRTETIILAGYMVLVVFLCTYNIQYVEGDPFYDKHHALLRYYAVRSGILASYLLPLSVLFAGRNNILQWITRWEFATFITLHRWVSRLIVVLIFIHSNNYAIIVKDHTPNIIHERFILWGIIGTYCAILITIQGMLVLRRRWYEMFLLLHIVLAAGYMVGAWIHVKKLHFLWYYYCSTWLWLCDRVFRIQRLVTFGFPMAQVKLYEDNTLKISVRKPSGFVAEGGGHCFVHFLQWHCFWQSHPFTYTMMGENIVFYVKVKEGMTLTLGQYLESSPEKTARIRVAVEGSYGEATPASKYDTSVFVAGGNGIPGIYAEAIQAAKTLAPGTTRKVRLLWVVRDYLLLAWFYDELISLKDTPIVVEIYVTSPLSSHRHSSGTDKLALLHDTYTLAMYMSVATVKDPEEQLREDLAHVEFHEGRPNIAGIVRSGIKESVGSVAFVTCGNPIMVDDLRHEVIQNIGKDNRRVDFFEQLQVWA